MSWALIAIYTGAPSLLNWGRKVVAPLRHRQGQEGAQRRGCQGKGWRLPARLAPAGSGSQDGVEDGFSRAGAQGMGQLSGN